KNNGTTTLTQVALTDMLASLGIKNAACGTDGNNQPITQLLPLQSTTCAKVYTVNPGDEAADGTITNHAFATALGPGGRHDRHRDRVGADRAGEGTVAGQVIARPPRGGPRWPFPCLDVRRLAEASSAGTSVRCANRA